MRKFIFVILILGLISPPLYARDLACTKASCIRADTTNFDGNLSGADTRVQSALETIDDIVIGDITDVGDCSSGACFKASGTGTTLLSPTGTMTLGGVDGTNNENLTFDFETGSDPVSISSSSGVTKLRLDELNLLMEDNDTIRFGVGEDVYMGWRASGNNSFQIGTRVGNAAYSGYISIMDRTQIGDDDRNPLATSADPVLRVYSSDATQANDYIEMYYDQTDANLDWGIGDLNIGSLAVGDVTLFEDTDVDNAAEGRKLVIHRKAAEGDDTLSLYVANNEDATILSSDGLKILASDYIQTISTGSYVKFQAGSYVWFAAAAGQSMYFDAGTIFNFRDADDGNDVMFKIDSSTGNITIGSADAGVDNTITFDGETNDGVMTYMEDEDRLDWDGNTQVAGDSTWTGDGSGIPFGHMYSNAAITVTITDTTPVEVGDTFTTGEVNSVTFGSAHYLVATLAGRYKVDWSMSISQVSPSSVIEVEGGIMINGAVQAEGTAHRSLSNTNDTGDMSSMAILDLVADEQISLYVANLTNAVNIDVEHANVTMIMLGGT